MLQGYSLSLNEFWPNKKKKENNPKFLAMRNWLNQLWYIHVVLHHVAIINNGEKNICNEMYNGLDFLMLELRMLSSSFALCTTPKFSVMYVCFNIKECYFLNQLLFSLSWDSNTLEFNTDLRCYKFCKCLKHSFIYNPAKGSTVHFWTILKL